MRLLIMLFMLLIAAPAAGCGSTALLSWLAPDTNTDGSLYDDPGGYVLHYGIDGGTVETEILASEDTQHTITGLSKGQYRISLQAVDAVGNLGETMWLIVPVK